MNIFELLIAKLNRKKIKRLNVGTHTGALTKSDTQEYITISTIQSILQDKNTFKKFMDSSKNQCFFSEGIGFDEYVQAVKDYVKFFLRKNIVLSKDELKRAQIITGEKYKNSRPKAKKDYTLDEIAALLLYVPNELSYQEKENEAIRSLADFTAFMQNEKALHSYNIASNICDFEVIDMDLRNAMLSIPSDFDSKSDVLRLDENMYVQINSLVHRIKEKNERDPVITVRKKFNPENFSLNPDFEKIIIDKIPKDITDRARLAFEIYKTVYSFVEYDVGYFIKSDDELSMDFIERIRNKKISELSEDHNRAICTTASELYCYFLSKYNIESNIVESKRATQTDKNRCHCCVEVILDDDVILADATDGIIDDNGNNMTDMTRIKLGLNPAHFKSKKGRAYSSVVPESAIGYNLQKEVDFISQMIQEQGLNSQSSDITIEQKIDIMQTQLKKLKDTNIGNFVMVQYMRSLFTRLFPRFSIEDTIGLSTSLYTNRGKDVYSYFPVIYLKRTDGSYSYYTYDSELGLKQITDEEIEDMTQKKELYVVKGKEGHIPGIGKAKNQLAVHEDFEV